MFPLLTRATVSTLTAVHNKDMREEDNRPPEDLGTKSLPVFNEWESISSESQRCSSEHSLEIFLNDSDLFLKATQEESVHGGDGARTWGDSSGSSMLINKIHTLINMFTCALTVLTYKQTGVDTRVLPQELFTHVDGRIIVVLHTEQDFILGGGGWETEAHVIHLLYLFILKLRLFLFFQCGWWNQLKK